MTHCGRCTFDTPGAIQILWPKKKIAKCNRNHLYDNMLQEIQFFYFFHLHSVHPLRYNTVDMFCVCSYTDLEQWESR